MFDPPAGAGFERGRPFINSLTDWLPMTASFSCQASSVKLRTIETEAYFLPERPEMLIGMQETFLALVWVSGGEQTISRQTLDRDRGQGDLDERARIWRWRSRVWVLIPFNGEGGGGGRAWRVGEKCSSSSIPRLSSVVWCRRNWRRAFSGHLS